MNQDKKLSGSFNSYYLVQVSHPQRKNQAPYVAECEDITDALGLTPDEFCIFKSIWRNAMARKGHGKPGNTSIYDAEKQVHYANRILRKALIAQALNQPSPKTDPQTTSEACHEHTSRSDQ